MSLKFHANERVLAFHGPLIYEAKVQKVSSDGSSKYFIHYHGWNKNWDEWVPEPRILKYTGSSGEITKISKISNLARFYFRKKKFAKKPST